VKAPDRQAVGLPEDGLYALALSRVDPERVAWLWPGRIPFGMLTLLIGDPGVGKSLLTILIAAEVSRAGHGVLLLSAEDHAGATIRPRAETADADLDRLHVVGARREGLEDGLVLPGDAGALDGLVAEHDARLLVVDPLSAHLDGSVNSWRDQSVRRALAPLHRLAQERGCAVVVVAHLNKGAGTDPLYRTGGSMGIPAAVRSALLLARDPDDPDGDRGHQRVLAHAKSNVSDLSDSLLCRVEATEEAAMLRVVGPSETGARDLLAAPDGGREAKRDRAAHMLRRLLRDGPRPVLELRAAAEDAGIGWRTVEAAKSDLGIQPRKQEGRLDGGWLWSLPDAVEGRRPDAADFAAFMETPSPSPSSNLDQAEDRKAADDAEPDARGTGCVSHRGAPVDGCRYCRAAAGGAAR
jgi:AAA domain